MIRTPEDRQAYAIARAVEHRRMELAPVRAEIADLMDAMSWHRARPIVRAALGRPVRKDGVWRLGKRDTLRVLEALREGPKGQASLFDWMNKP